MTSYELTLFVSGASDLSARAIASAKELCEIHLEGPYHLSVIDVHEDSAAVLDSDVRVAPTLIKHLPLPARRVVGDVSDTEKVLRALELPLPAGWS
jgi:circadian clock protein KaiB